jgi:sec-independent protein translocase protein TatC
MAIGEAKMSIWGHLGELRRRITVIIVALLVAVCVIYFFSPQLIVFMSAPIAGYLPGNLGDGAPVLTVLDPLGGFTLRFKVSFFFAVICTCPIWIWQLMLFFLPALKPKERRWVVPTFLIGVFLFLLGAVFCYFVILAPAFEWMLSQTIDFANVLPNAGDYIGLVLLFEIGFGVAFELPLVVFYLTIFNIVPYKKLRASWRVVYIALMLISAMVTPDANPVTMVLMFAAMAALYEASLLVSRIVLRKRIKAQEAEAKAEEAEEAAEGA